MNIKLHVSQKTINEDGTTVISFVPILVGDTGILSGGNLTLNIPTSEDNFTVGNDYDGSFAEVV